MSAHEENLKTEKEEEEKILIIEDWLVAGPASMPLPALVGENAGFQVKNLLDFDVVDPIALWPEEGRTLSWYENEKLAWIAKKTEGGILKIPAKKKGPEVAFLSCYIENERWLKANFEISSPHLFKAFLDYTPITTKAEASKWEAREPSQGKEKVSLSSGKHRLLTVAIKDHECAVEWTIKTSIRTKQKCGLNFNLIPQRFLTEDDIYNSAQIGSVFVAPDGSAVAYTMTQHNPKTGKSESWIEIRKLPGGELEQAIRDSQEYTNFQWSPDSRWLSVIVPGEKETSDLWLIERGTRRTRILLDNIKGLSRASWSPTGKFLIYYLTEKPEEPVPKVKRMTGLQDRWFPRFGRTHIYMVMVDSGVCHRLTAGNQSATGIFRSVASPISPDGSKILFITSQPDYRHRPYLQTNLYLLDLATNEARLVFTSPFSINSPLWTIDGKYVLFVGGQSIAKILPDEKIPNDYDNDLFLLDPSTGSVKSLTQDFNPSVKSALQTKDGSIYLHVDDKARVQLYLTDTKGSKIAKIDTGIDAVKSYDVSSNGRQVVFTGSSLLHPDQLFALDLKTKKRKLLFDPNQERFKNIVLTKVEDFHFKNDRGVNIEGWLHYPANFDPQKKYPLIVYYYGGTAQTPRDFSAGLVGTHHHYTANGYAVYVLNPSGAPGWGPGFSDLHVNDWGKIVSEEIITGVEELLKAKPFLNSNKVGAYGGSYGGFMTMLLATKTDIFSAFVALYGISNIASYWGTGWWGFLYSGIASANSFPWNRPDIYVEQSPLFHADKIKTPLLLIHGDADINVFVTESEQIYTALKILGREVDYVRFKDEDHGIRGTDENRRLFPKLMLAWWDKYLKGQPEAWEEIEEKAIH